MDCHILSTYITFICVLTKQLAPGMWEDLWTDIVSVFWEILYYSITGYSLGTHVGLQDFSWGVLAPHTTV